MTSTPKALAHSLSTLRLLQLCSPALPIGAFAYSQGLEQAIERQYIQNAQELRSWLHGVLTHNLAATDLPLLLRAITLWASLTEASVMGQPASPNEHDLSEHCAPLQLCRTVLSYRETSELRAEEQHLGRSLARVLAHLGIAQATPYAARPEASYVVMFGLAAAHFDLSANDACIGFAFSWLENQVGAASRLMRLGQLAAQEVVSSLLEDIIATSHVAQTVLDSEIGYSPPGFCLMSAWHEEQYSRLFRS